MNEETKRPEPIAAILAEMRADVADGENAFFIRADWLSLCDRLDAAAERERVSATGNDADLRASLNAVIKKLLEVAPTAEQEWPELVEQARAALERKPEENYGNAAAMRAAIVNVASFAANAIDYDGPERDVDAYRWLGRIAQTASAALAAPARNCDRFATAEEAVAAFADHLRAWENAHGICSEYPDHAVQVPAGAFAWLFGKAEGGAE